MISDAERTRELADDESELAKRFQGSRAIKRKIEYGMSDEVYVGIRRTREKAKLITNIWANGLRMTHR